MRENKYSVLIKNTTLLSLGLFGAKFVQFILLPYFTHILTPKEYGTIDLTVTFISLIIPIITMNLADAVLRFGLSRNENKEEILNAALMILLISSVLTIIIFGCFKPTGSIGKWKGYVTWIIIIQSFRVNFSLYVKAEEKIAVYSIDSIFYAFVTAGCDILFLSYYQMGVKGYFLAEIVGNFCSVLFLVWKGNLFCRLHLLKNHNKTLMLRMVKYSSPLMFNAISWWITSFSDRFILNIYYSESDVGIYSVAAKMPAIVTTALSVFTQAWIMSSIKEYETEKDSTFFKKVYLLYSGALTVIISVAILFIQPFMKIYVGSSFSDSWKYVPFLLIGTIYLGISNYFGAFYAAAKKNIKEVITTFIGAGSNILLNFMLIPRFGIMGAVIATMLSYVIIALVRIWDTRCIFVLDISLGLILCNMFLVFLEAICAVLLKNYYMAVICAGLIAYINLKPIIRELQLKGRK